MKISRLALAIALAPTASFATDNPRLDEALKLNELVVTSQRTVQNKATSSSDITVFTRADIDQLRPANVLELLTHVPGVQVANYGGRGALYGLYIRGTSSAQSLVLIDGARVGAASAGMTSLQYLSVDQIERIEVLRGTRSAIYGADAIGGVVQIFTRRSQGEGLRPFLRLAGGSDHAWERTLGLSGGDARTRFNLSASSEETAGYDRTRTSFATDADHDAYRNRGISFSLNHLVSDFVEVGLNVLDQRGKTEIDNPFGRWDNNLFASFPAQPYDHFSVSSSSAYLDADVHERWNTRVELGHAEDKQENFDKLFPGSSVNNNYRDTATWLNSIQLSERHSLLAGIDYLNDKLHSSNESVRTSRWNKGALLQHSYNGETFSTEMGLRHDQNQQFGSANTFNAALTLPINLEHSVILSYAEGFRVPTLNDLYWPADAASWYVGNPRLKPERSKSYEIKWRYQGEKLQLESSLYQNNLRDLIASSGIDPVTGFTTPENIDKARINGLELSASGQVFGWQVKSGVSFLDARDLKTGLRLPNRARRTLFADVDKSFGKFGVGFSWRASSRTQSYNWDKTETYEMAGYGVLDLRASWQASTELSFDAKWSNALDKDYSRLLYSYQGQQYGYKEAPSSFMLGMTWTPNL